MAVNARESLSLALEQGEGHFHQVITINELEFNRFISRADSFRGIVESKIRQRLFQPVPDARDESTTATGIPAPEFQLAPRARFTSPVRSANLPGGMANLKVRVDSPRVRYSEDFIEAEYEYRTASVAESDNGDIYTVRIRSSVHLFRLSAQLFRVCLVLALTRWPVDIVSTLI